MMASQVLKDTNVLGIKIYIKSNLNILWWTHLELVYQTLLPN